MTSQKTIERCRARVSELSLANKTLLDNNVILAAENTKLREEVKRISKRAEEVETQRRACVMKCETTISEKNRILQEKERYIQNLHDTVWHLKNSFKCEHYSFVETQAGFKIELAFGRKP